MTDEARAIADRITSSFAAQGLMRHLGARLERIEPGAVTISLLATPDVSQQHGYVHAGATGAIADSAGGYAAMTRMPLGSEVLTVEYKLNLLAPAIGERIEATARVVRAGRTITVCALEATAIRDGERSTIAVGQQTLIRIDTRPRRSSP